MLHGRVIAYDAKLDSCRVDINLHLFNGGNGSDFEPHGWELARGQIYFTNKGTIFSYKLGWTNMKDPRRDLPGCCHENPASMHLWGPRSHSNIEIRARKLAQNLLNMTLEAFKYSIVIRGIVEADFQNVNFGITMQFRDGFFCLLSDFMGAGCIKKIDQVKRMNREKGENRTRLLFLINQSLGIGIVKSSECEQNVHRLFPVVVN
jgi:hypothetical protein